MEEKKPQKELPLIKRQDTYKIIIPAEVEEKIRFLCNRIHEVEWSGVLFYKHSGNFEDDTLEIKCVDIFPMDIGSSGYTEFNMHPDVVGYMADHDLLDCQTGLIHSHNNMSTFFSGTDTATLKEEGRDRNHFVSLIVNNAGTYTAAITRRIKYVETRKLSYPTFEGKEIIDVEETFEEAEELEYFYLDIVFENRPVSKFQEISERLDTIKKTKAEIKAKSTPTAITTNQYGGYPSSYYGLAAYPRVDFGSYTEKVKEPTLWDKTDEEIEMEEDIRAYNRSFGIEEVLDIDPKTQAKVTDKLIDDLLCQLITGSITMSYYDKFDPKKWVESSMVGLFEKRFGRGFDGLTHCREWAIDFTEYICNCSIDTEDRDETEIAYLISSKLIEKLKALPKNDFIDIFIDLLTTYAEYI